MRTTSRASALLIGVLVSASASAGGTVGGWRELPLRHQATSEGQAVVLKDGRILQIGGFESYVWQGGALSTDCEIYDPRRPNSPWVECAPMPVGHGMFWAATLPSGNVLVAGNFVLPENDGPFTSYVYVTARDQWVKVAGGGGPAKQLGNPHSILPILILDDGSALLAGGFSNGPVFASNQAWRFVENRGRPEKGAWVRTGDMPYGAVSASFVKLSDGRALFAGGLVGEVVLADGTWSYIATAQSAVYDPRTGTWKSTGLMPEAVGVDDSATVTPEYFVGGPDCERSDGSDPTCPPGGNWFNPGGRWHPGGAALPDGDALIVGGSTWGATDGGGGGYWSYARNSAVRFDGATDTWSEAAPSEHWRHMARAVTLPLGFVLMNGGYQASAAEFYSPYTDRWYDAGSYSDLPGCPEVGWSEECYNLEEFGGQLRALGDGRAVQTCGYDWNRAFPDVGCDRAWIWTPWAH